MIYLPDTTYCSQQYDVMVMPLRPDRLPIQIEVAANST